jgi:hypothetical protein
MTRITANIAFAASILAGAALYKVAEHRGWLPPDRDGRFVQAIIGLTLVVFANFIPKNLKRWRTAEAERRAQIASRVAGWSFALAGIVYAAVWLLAPLAIADTASTVAVVCALVVTFATTVWACTGRRDGAATPAHDS